MIPGRRPAALACVLAVMCAIGCAGLPVGGPDESSARREYSAAVRLVGSRPAQAMAAFEAFLREHPRSALADDAGLRLAELQHGAGAPVAAIRTLQRVVQLHPAADRTDAARLLLARLLAERGDLDAAYDAATRVRFSRLDAESRRRAHRLLAEIARQRGDDIAHLRWLGQVQQDASDAAGRRHVEREVRAVLSGMNERALEAAAEQLGPRPPAVWVGLRRAALRHAAGDDAGARARLDEVRGFRLSPEEADAVRVADGRLAGGEAQRLLHLDDAIRGSDLRRAPLSALRARGVLGVVLPLSGAYAGFGEESLQGILLSTGHFDVERRGPPSGIRLRVRDTGGDPARAAAAVSELAADPDVTAIVGPLLGDESEAAAAAAEAAGVPLLALSNRETVGQGRPHVVRLGATPRLDAELVATYAVETLGLRRFAILYPDIPFGRALRRAFWDAVEARGGEIVGVARYASDATDFAAPIRRLIGYDLLSYRTIEAIRERDRMMKRAKRLPPEEAAELREEARALRGPDDAPLPPFVDFEALFIPDAFETVGLIGPHLAFHEVRGVRLLGTSAWNDPELLRLAGRHLDGAVFAAGSDATSTRPMLAEFVRRSEASFERVPGDVSAAAFDAATLASAALAREGKTRSGFLHALRGLRRWSGVSGTIGFEPDGTVWKRPHLLGIERGKLVSVDERGAPPYLRIPEPELHCEEGPDGTEVCTPPSDAADAHAVGDASAKTSR